MSHIRTIIEKEWAEVFKNRMVLFTIIFLPLIFTVMPLAMLYFTGSASEEASDMPAAFAQVCGNIPAADCMQVYLIGQFLLMFMIMPLMIPVAIAAYSVVGEKTTRSLEPLLATPITTEELLAGKGLAAAIPAVLATWICFGLFVLAMPLVGATPGAISYVLGPTWLLAILVVGPLMAVAAVNVALIISSRVSDPRVAEQLSAILVIPLMTVMFAQIGGLLVVNAQLMYITILVMLLLDVAAVYLGARIFQRENILTRWK